MKFWLYFPLWIFFGDEVINLGLSLASSPSGPSGPSGWKAHSSSLVLTCPHSHTWHQAVCVCVCACALSHVWYFVTPWAVDCQTPLSMEFSRQENWSGYIHFSRGLNPGLLHCSKVPYYTIVNFLKDTSSSKGYFRAFLSIWGQANSNTSP